MLVVSQEQLDAELDAFPWHDAVIREAHVLSPTYVKPDRSQVAPDSDWSFRILVCSSDVDHPALEFVFEEVDHLALTSRVDLEPRGDVSNDGIALFMTRVDTTAITAKRLRLRRLGQEAWGHAPRHGEASVFDERGFPVDD